MLDDGNTSTDLLGAGEEFTGRATQVTDLVRILNLVVTDKPGTLYIEYSIDGETWPAAQSKNVAPGVPLFEDSRLGGKWYRVRYLNGGQAQTLFFLASSTFYNQGPS